MRRVLPLLLLAGCTVGAPPGFSGGDAWSFPLVGPLEGGPLVVPVNFGDKGPYLFTIDPDSPRSHIDIALASELGLRSGYGPEFVDESDKLRPTKFAEVTRISIGDLTVRSKTFYADEVGTFNVAGRQIRGVIGKDILADSLVFGFDRSTGRAWIATQKGFTRPADAVAIGYDRLKPEVLSGEFAISRRMARATINGASYKVHLDLGGPNSQLREEKWAGAGLAEVALQRQLLDEVGTKRVVSKGGVAGEVSLGAVSAKNLLFVPYGDKRWNELVIDGSLGLDFFDGHAVAINFDDDVVFVSPETAEADVKGRVARWGSAKLDACAQPACTRANLVQAEPAAAEQPAGDALQKPAPPPGKPILYIERTAEVADLAFEVLIEPRAADGGPSDLPRMIAIFPAGTTQLTTALEDRFAGATFQVVDVDPFPRTCAREGACVYFVGEKR
jgi:hypothetical protein